MSHPSSSDQSSSPLISRPPVSPRNVPLSPQQQILTRLLTAQAPKQIASDIGLSIHTVRDHIQKIYRKFGVSGREELMARFLLDDPARCIDPRVTPA